VAEARPRDAQRRLLGEAFVYNDEINHLEPDLTSARDTIARLIGAKTPRR
jgi:hypothetical protein